MGYLINPVLFPWKINLSAADCIAGGNFNIDQFLPLPGNQYYQIIGTPILYYNFNSIDFDNLDVLLKYRTASNYYYKAQITSFPGYPVGCLMAPSFQNGAMDDVIYVGDYIVIEISGVATVGNGSVNIQGYATINTI